MGLRGFPVAKYEIIIFWSLDDKAFVAEVPELSGCKAHGDSYEKALANVQEAMTLWIQTAKELGRRIPKAKGDRLIFA